MIDLQEYRKKVNAALQEYRTAKATQKELRSEYIAANQKIEDWATAQQEVQYVAKDLQQSVHTKIAAIVSKSLQIVFEDNAYEFRIEFEVKRGKTEARLLFYHGEFELNPFSASGGGVIDVAAFALRLAALMLTTPAPRPLLILDEPFRFVHSAEYRMRVRKLLETFSKEMGVQIIMVTGVDEFRTGKILEIQ